jgi:hypothetical protein
MVRAPREPLDIESPAKSLAYRREDLERLSRDILANPVAGDDRNAHVH